MVVRAGGLCSLSSLLPTQPVEDGTKQLLVWSFIFVCKMYEKSSDSGPSGQKCLISIVFTAALINGFYQSLSLQFFVKKTVICNNKT